MGIAIAYTDLQRFRDRCSMTAVSFGTGDPDYDAEALLPADRWTALPHEVAAEMHAHADVEASRIVELVRMPEIAALDAIHRFDPFGGQ
ncbi:hypothetical protein KDL01_29360 [Actinospica durhamensis]|uniref:Uncharacterized protein n=1 Tax=Actinospica durhamensis TaxID=1508375 RepID=A0A941EZU7_9ACTN|nr:hypothetical protein [Actinospica durhamensis]MBR7837424.1 hypothetical protein [Actinospica durhamensis]